MKKTYGKPMVSFESFAFSSNIAGGCGDIIGIQSGSAATPCASYGTQASPDNGCVFISGTAVIFNEQPCLEPPQENDDKNLCYHVSTDATRMFMS